MNVSVIDRANSTHTPCNPKQIDARQVSILNNSAGETIVTKRTSDFARIFLVVFVLVAFNETNSVADDPSPGKQVSATAKFSLADGDAKTEVEVRHWIFLPADYGKKESGSPLLLFLHGAGERGNNLPIVKKHGPPKIVDSKTDFPFLTVSPQCASGKRWNPNEMIGFIDYLEANYKIDKSRIYVTGLSMGGYGTWSILAKNTGRIAAAIPICGGGNPDHGKNMTDVPIWAFHGDADPVVPVSRSEKMIEAIKAAEGAKAKLTLYPGVEHDSWTKTYDNPEIYKWLLSHTVETKEEK
jgi:predicted peptidase